MLPDLNAVILQVATLLSAGNINELINCRHDSLFAFFILLQVVEINGILRTATYLLTVTIKSNINK